MLTHECYSTPHLGERVWVLSELCYPKLFRQSRTTETHHLLTFDILSWNYTPFATPPSAHRPLHHFLPHTQTHWFIAGLRPTPIQFILNTASRVRVYFKHLQLYCPSVKSGQVLPQSLLLQPQPVLSSWSRLSPRFLWGVISPGSTAPATTGGLCG